MNVSSSEDLSRVATAVNVPVGKFFTFDGDPFLFLRVDDGCVRFRRGDDPMYFSAHVMADNQWKNPIIQPEGFSVTLGGK